ncbi:MAG: hypothetical protein LWW95_08195 [Candidatus Desulfofervidus auxilii]|nr:hypothetical protein [Candidatus Desulfofervidus auxilii]
MRKFSAIFQEKENISKVRIIHKKGITDLFFSVKGYDPKRFSKYIYEIFKGSPKFFDIKLFRKRIPFYSIEIRDFLALNIKKIPIFFWIFIFALCGVAYEKI